MAVAKRSQRPLRRAKPPPRRSVLARAPLAAAAVLCAVAALVVAAVAPARCAAEVGVVRYEGVDFLVRGDGGVLGAQFVDAPEAAAFRGWAVQRSAAAVAARARTALVVGVGAGSVVAGLARSGVDVDGVDVDPAVAAAAVERFGAPAGSVRVADGLAALAERDARDIVVIDVVDPSDPAGPALWRFLEPEALADARASADGGRGLVVFNVVDDAPFALAAAAAARLAGHFTRVRAFRDSPAADGGATNCVFYASDANFDDAVRALRAGADAAEPGTDAWVAATFPDWELLRCDGGACGGPARHFLRGLEPPPRADLSRRPPPAYGAALGEALRAVADVHLPAAARPPLSTACAAARWVRRLRP